MNKNKSGIIAAEHFKSGFNCAEAVSLSIIETLLKNQNTDIPRVASFFGGGIGSTHQEICGAISGAVIVTGLVLGRNNPDKDIDEHKLIIKDILDEFKNNFKTTNCSKLIEGLDDDAKSEKCTNIVKFTANLIYSKLS